MKSAFDKHTLEKISDFLKTKVDFASGEIPYTAKEKELLILAVLETEPDIVLDWGTHIGISARLFYELGQYFSLDYKVHTVDLKEEGSHPERPTNNGLGKHIVDIPDVSQHFGDGIEKSLEIFANGYFDKPLFFVDGDHQQKTVSRELSLIFEVVENPFVLVHDTWSKGQNNGPWQACCLAKEKYNLEMFSVDNEPPGMTFLKRKIT